jgi:hypothetical protein
LQVWTLSGMHRPHRIPLWLKIAVTLVAAMVLPIYWHRLGPTNYLWLSDMALILIVPALWLEQRLLISMLNVMVLPLELGWNLGFLWGLFTDDSLFGLASYMFDPDEALLIRILSGSFHIALPVALLTGVIRLGYDPRALLRQIPLTWLILLATWALTGPQANINFIYGLGHGAPWTPLPQPLHVLGLMVLIPLLGHLPTHLVLTRCCSQGRAARAAGEPSPPG